MPFVEHRGAELYWEEHGRGEPLLLIMGLSFPLTMWFRLLPALAARYRVVLFDNRGVGRSGVPPGPYSIPLMADDAAAVLQAAGLDSAHVLGASMGGMIAQELTRRHPDKVRTLLLGCSSGGGWTLRRHSLGLLGGHLRAQPWWNRESWMHALASLMYHRDTPAHRINEDVAVRLRDLPSLEGYRNQLLGLLCWSSWRWLPRIPVPTLVMHGDADRIIPHRHGELLARRIPGAEFHLIPNGGHMLMTDQQELVEERVLAFLERQAKGSSSAAA